MRRATSQDLTHNYFLETGARNNKLKIYETVEHPAARAPTGFLLVRGGVHPVAYARAVENLTGANMSKLFPAPRIETAKIPEWRPHIEKGLHAKLYRFSPNDYLELSAVWNGNHPRPATRSSSSRARRRACCRTTGRRNRTSSRPSARRRRSPRSRCACARPPACPTRPPAPRTAA